MAALSPSRIAGLLEPFFPDPPALLLEQLSTYLDLLLKWNAYTNLTAIRDAEEIVTRHFGESLFAARNIPADAETLLDLGSGGGFPGIPIQLAHPHLKVTLAESQGKKAAFLREVIRSLALPTAVWASRAELLPPHSFDVVALRAVDRPDQALILARELARSRGTILHLAGQTSPADQSSSVPMPGPGRTVLAIIAP